MCALGRGRENSETVEKWILGMSVVRWQQLIQSGSGTSLGRTDANDECPSQKCTTSEQRGVLETSTATETAVNRECARIALYLGPDRFDLQFATKELARDMQTLIMLSTLRLRRSAWYLVGAADVSPFFVHSDEPGTTLVWADADCSGDAMTCKSTSAGAVQLENCGIEAWSVVQQVVSFSSDESESHVTEMSKVDRWETLDHRRSQNRRIGAYPETRAEDVLNGYWSKRGHIRGGCWCRRSSQKSEAGLACDHERWKKKVFPSCKLPSRQGMRKAKRSSKFSGKERRGCALPVWGMGQAIERFG